MRLPRLDFPGARHHVMNRTAHGRRIFDDVEARALFLDTLEAFPKRFGVHVHGFALMPNHYHLMLGSERGQLSRAMRHLGSEFTRQLNRVQGGRGPLFRGRFHNRVVDSDAYWRHLLLYLHLNPVRAGLTDLDRAEGTSHAIYLGRSAAPAWMRTDELTEAFGSVEAYLDAYQGLHEGTVEPPDSFDAERLWAPNKTGALTNEQRRPYTLAQALEDVCAVSGLDVDGVLASPRGRGGNPVNWLAAWWMNERGIDHGSIRRALHTSHSAVSLRIRRIEERKGTDPKIREWTRALADRWIRKG